MTNYLSPLALLAAIKNNSTMVHWIKFKGVGAERLLLVDKVHRKSFLLLTTAECVMGPGCDTCQARVSTAVEQGYKVYCHPKNQHVFSEIEYSETLFTETPTLEAFLSLKMPFTPERWEGSEQGVSMGNRFDAWRQRMF